MMNISEPSPFTDDEAKVMQHLLEAHQAFILLETTHPDEVREWADGVHTLQNLLGWRVLRRAYPGLFFNITN